MKYPSPARPDACMTRYSAYAVSARRRRPLAVPAHIHPAIRVGGLRPLSANVTRTTAIFILPVCEEGEVSFMVNLRDAQSGAHLTFFNLCAATEVYTRAGICLDNKVYDSAPKFMA